MSDFTHYIETWNVITSLWQSPPVLVFLIGIAIYNAWEPLFAYRQPAEGKK